MVQGNDGVVQCVIYGQSTNAYLSYNGGHDNNRLVRPGR